MRKWGPPYSGLCGFPEAWESYNNCVVSRDIYMYSFWWYFPLLGRAVMSLLSVLYSCVEKRYLLWRKTTNVGCSKTKSLTCATTPSCYNSRLGAIGSNVRNLWLKFLLSPPLPPDFPLHSCIHFSVYRTLAWSIVRGKIRLHMEHLRSTCLLCKPREWRHRNGDVFLRLWRRLTFTLREW
jgi:hypothetical protein